MRTSALLLVACLLFLTIDPVLSGVASAHHITHKPRSLEVVEKTKEYGGELDVVDVETTGQVVKKSESMGTYVIIILSAIGILYGVALVWNKSLELRETSSCSRGEIMSLGITHVDSQGSAFRFLGPFANEITNVLTLTTPLNIYPHHTHNSIQLLEKTLIDTIALIGILSNVAKYAGTYGEARGMFKGQLLLLFSFVVPNLLMDRLLNNDKRFWGNPKTILGLFIIYCLDLTVNFIWCHVVGELEHGDNHGTRVVTHESHASVLTQLAATTTVPVSASGSTDTTYSGIEVQSVMGLIQKIAPVIFTSLLKPTEYLTAQVTV